MAKGKTRTEKSTLPPTLFAKPAGRRRAGLVLSRFLAEEAEFMHLRGPEQDAAHKILIHWAELERQGHLAKKETALDADFMHEVFGQALHYQSATESPEDYQQERNFSIPGIGTADGALGNFTAGSLALSRWSSSNSRERPWISTATSSMGGPRCSNAGII